MRPSATGVETERENRTKTIAVHGEALAARELAQASDAMMAHPLALELRNLQTRVELPVNKNSTVVFPAHLSASLVFRDLSAWRSSHQRRRYPCRHVPCHERRVDD